VLTEKLDIRIANELLDQSVTNTDQKDIEKNTRLHLHCWHTDLPFSKFYFKTNKYNCINPLSFINDTSAKAYVCFNIQFIYLLFQFIGYAYGIRIKIFYTTTNG
jgi:hypothetical protein